MSDFCRRMPYTEQQIRGLAINFLRFHYKLRPRYMGGETSVVDRPHYYRGVLIDARLAYQKPDRSYFTATVEATSVDRQDEIRYQTNYWRITLHTLVWSLSVFAIIVWAAASLEGGGLDVSPVETSNPFRMYDRPQAYLLLFSGWLAVFATVFAGLRQLRRYRYIYAVDQFKHFHADAQWVAFDAQIFAANTWRSRRYYRELERQCVCYGFGMLAVEADKVVRNVMSPSQVDQFGGHRIPLPRWLARAEEGAGEGADPPALGPAEEVAALPPPSVPSVTRRRLPAHREPCRRLLLVRARLRRAYRGLFPSALRRRPGYYRVGGWVWLLGPAAVAAGVLGVARLANYEAIAQEGQRDAAPDLTVLEPAGDAAAPPLAIEEGEYQRQTDSIGPADEVVQVPEDALVAGDEIASLDDLRRYRLSAEGAVTVDYDCLPLYTIGETVYVLLFGEYRSFEAAREWALELNRLYQSPVTVAAGDCVTATAAPTDYLVYIDGPTRNEGAANLMARNFLRRSGLEVEILVIE